MKVQCPSCREIVEMANFSTADEGLSFQCINCGQDNFLANPRSQGAAVAPDPAPAVATKPEPARPQPPEAKTADPDEIICPKCGNSQRDAHACHLCGLVFTKFDPYTAPADPPEAVAIWARIEAQPQDEDLNDAFIKVCLATGRLDYGSRKYRLLGRQAQYQELAERMIAQLTTRGQAQLAPGSLATAQREDPKRKGRIIMWVVMIVMGALFSYFLLNATDVSKMMGP